MSDKKKIYKPLPISGFPEWLPEFRAVELVWLDKIRAVFERYGYCSLETPAVEALEAITAKGEDVDKEIYVLERLQADPDEKKDARLALHFDQTVPFARYVAQHFDKLTFPFKRYQMQKVWRGERPQKGRMREFTQCDIDVINVDSLPLSFDAEVAAICYEALAALDIGRVQLRVSNRKILMGFLETVGVKDEWSVQHVTRCIDKIEKVGIEKTLEIISVLDVLQEYPDTPLANEDVIDRITPFVKFLGKTYQTSRELEDALTNHRDFNTANDTMREGIDELTFVLDQLSHLPEHAVVADLSIVRGLDYYTGTVYETRLLDVPDFTGSVCSGGRYDDLAGGYINKHLPGVGISIGFSRLFDVMRQSGKIAPGPRSPAHVLVALPSEQERSVAQDTARALRGNGLNVEVYHAAQKIGKQIAYAEKKNIPYVWFPFSDGHQVKNMETGAQEPADPGKWSIDK